MKNPAAYRSFIDLTVREFFRRAGNDLSIENIIRRFIYDEKNITPFWKIWIPSNWKMVKNPNCATVSECKKYLLDILRPREREEIQRPESSCLLQRLEQIISSVLTSCPDVCEIPSLYPGFTGGHPVFF